MSRNVAKVSLELATHVSRSSPVDQRVVALCAVLLGVGCATGELATVSPPDSSSAPCPTTSQLYIIDDVELPLSAAQAASLGLNLDGDPGGRADNGAGVALSWLLASWTDAGAMLHARLRAAFEDRRVLWLVEVETCADEAQGPGSYVRIGVHRGAPSGAAGAAEIADRSPPAQGWRLEGGVVRARAGEGMVPASSLMDFSGVQEEVLWVRGDGLAVELEASGRGEVRGRMGLGFDDGLRQVAAIVMSDFYTVKLGEGTSDFARSLDVNENGEVAPEEFLGASAVRTLLLDDVDLMAAHDGRVIFWPGHDGVNDRLSLGLWFHAHLVTD